MLLPAGGERSNNQLGLELSFKSGAPTAKGELDLPGPLKKTGVEPTARNFRQRACGPKGFSGLPTRSQEPPAAQISGFKHSVPVPYHPRCLEDGYPAWIRTMTKGFKDPCATFTPPSSSRDNRCPDGIRIESRPGELGQTGNEPNSTSPELFAPPLYFQIVLPPDFQKKARCALKDACNKGRSA